MVESNIRDNLLKIKALIDECLTNVESPQLVRTAKSIPRFLTDTQVDLNIPIRPFIKKHAKGMSGPKKFTLLLAKLAKGDLKAEIALSEIERNWNKMRSTSLMGMNFNRFYPIQAKNNDWVDSARKGFYKLRPSWRQIFH